MATLWLAEAHGADGRAIYAALNPATCVFVILMPGDEIAIFDAKLPGARAEMLSGTLELAGRTLALRDGLGYTHALAGLRGSSIWVLGSAKDKSGGPRPGPLQANRETGSELGQGEPGDAPCGEAELRVAAAGAADEHGTTAPALPTALGGARDRSLAKASAGKIGRDAGCYDDRDQT